MEKFDKTKALLLGNGQDLTGHQVKYWKDIWIITGKNYIGDWNVERYENRPSGPVKITSSIDAKILPEEHPHYAQLVPLH